MQQMQQQQMQLQITSSIKKDALEDSLMKQLEGGKTDERKENIFERQFEDEQQQKINEGRP